MGLSDESDDDEQTLFTQDPLPDTNKDNIKLLCEKRKLESWEDTPVRGRTRTQTRKARHHQVHAAGLTSDPGLPRTFREAMNSPEAEQWLKAAKTEIRNFNERKCLRIISRNQIGKNKTILNTRWIFVKKVEQDGSIRYKARLVVKGYEQIPGVDYTEKFSPVAGDTTIRIMIALCLYYPDWILEAIDLETAFLNALMEEEVYIEIPEGFLDGDFDNTEINQKI